MRAALSLLTVLAAIAPLRAESLPKPVLVYVNSRHETASAGGGLTRYHLAVSNYAEYSADLFEAAPNLPPCGRNTRAARTWVEIFGDKDERIYGFCALKSPAELQQIWFAVPDGASPPKWVRVEIRDRLTGRSADQRLDLPSAR